MFQVIIRFRTTKKEMNKKIDKIKIYRLLSFSLIAFVAFSFSSCLYEKKKDEFALLATAYRLEIPAFNPPFGEVEIKKRINVIYVITSNRLLGEHDIFEKTDNLFEPVNVVYVDTLKLIFLDAAVDGSKIGYIYECYSNKYIDVSYKPQNLEEYYHAIKDIIKNTELVYKDGSTHIAIKKFEGYKESFIVETDIKIPHGKKIYNVDGW
jgi:hypothetical protein